jgi:hypothetical protein
MNCNASSSVNQIWTGERRQARLGLAERCPVRFDAMGSGKGLDSPDAVDLRPGDDEAAVSVLQLLQLIIDPRRKLGHNFAVQQLVLSGNRCLVSRRRWELDVYFHESQPVEGPLNFRFVVTPKRGKPRAAPA